MKQWSEILRNVTMLSQLGLSFITPLLLCLALCWFIISKTGVGVWVYIPGFFFGMGGSATVAYKFYTPNMVLGPDRKGIKVTYTTDTRPTESILRNAAESDLFICEGMYGEEDKIEKAKGYKHMTFREAAALARDANVKELWLTHYSPSLIHPEEYMDMVRGIFPNAWPGKDGKSVELNFEED